MNPAYLGIKTITSLDHVLKYLEKIEDPTSVAVFFDWDDTLVNPDHDNIIEPEVTKKLFDHLKTHQIFYAIITGRFHDTVCDDNKRNIFNMKHNMINTIYPSLQKLGVNTDRYLSDEYTNNIYKIRNERGECVGVLYMGIIFTGRKGETIKNYFRQTGIKRDEVLFVDDYEPYLIETTSSMPSIKAFRRKTGYN